ncbi:MAG: type II and III secretion system protein family protein [Sphingorhabdus sp.]
MTSIKNIKSGIASIALAASLGTVATLALPASANAQSAKSARTITLSIGRGQQINLPRSITDVTVSDPRVADIEVKTARQIYIHARGPGETTVYATDASGANVMVLNVRVGNNIDSLDQMLSLAMPEAEITVTTMNGVILLTGAVAQPEDAAEAERLVDAFVNGRGGNTKVVSRLRMTTPLQVNLQVRIAEVSRSLAKEINGNLATRDGGGGFLFGVQRGRDFVNIGDIDTSSLPQLDASAQFGLPPGSLSLPFDPSTGRFVTGGTQFNFKNLVGGNIVQAAGRLFGLDVAAAFDLSERAGLSTTLAQPNLTTVSGETATFQAGGSFPIPTSSGLGATSVEFRDFGVLLTYTPTVLSNGRISLRVKPEVSDISSQGAVRINGFEIPAITTRTVETTVELGSGQSMMIAGLMSNNMQSSIDKVPGAGDLPIIGSLFRSNGWRKNETELVIVITPYLVKPVSGHKIKLPTDGFNSPNDLERVILNKWSSDKGVADRPKPTVAPAEAQSPEFRATSEAAPAVSAPVKKQKKQAQAKTSAPGFSFD